MKPVKLFFDLFFLILLCTACSLFKSSYHSKRNLLFSKTTNSKSLEKKDGKNIPLSISEDIKPCRRDSDCVLVNKDCCSCANGGRSIVIHKSQKRKIMKQLKNRCKNVTQRCLAVYLCDKWKARCLNSKCEITDKVKQ